MMEPSGWDKAEVTLLMAYDWAAWIATIVFAALAIVDHSWSPWGWVAVLVFGSSMFAATGAVNARKEINKMRQGSKEEEPCP